MRLGSRIAARRRHGRGAVATLLASLMLTLSCGREITGPAGALQVSAPLAFITEFRQLPGQSALRSGVEFTKLRATLLRLNGSVAIDRTVDFPSDADSINLSLTATFGPAATSEGEEMVLLLRFITAAGDTVFRSGPDTVFVETVRSGTTPTPVTVEPEYVGPGAEATRVVLSQTVVSVTGSAGNTFTAQAFDASNAIVANAPILFSSADTTLVKFLDARSGVATTVARRDSTLVFASLLNGASDTARVRVTLPASTLAIVTGDVQGGTVGATLAAPVTVRVTASDAIGVAGVAVTFAVTEGSVGATSVLTDNNGEASTSWTLGPSVGTQSLTASVAGLTGSPVTFTATAEAGAAVALSFTAQPTTAVAGSSLGSITVTARDAGANIATSFDGGVTIAIGANAGGGTLGGTQTVAAVNGVATFADLNIDRSGTGYTLVASSAGLSNATSGLFNITPGAATALAFTVQPSSGPINTALAPPVQVEARDALGNRASDFTGSVSVAFASNPGAANLGGTLARSAVAGVATFNDLTVDAIAAGYSLTATAAGLSDATSATFNTSAELNAWLAASNGTWSTGSNWSLGRAPIATDSVVIAVPGTYTVTLDADFAGTFVVLGAASGTQTLAMSGRTLTIAGELIARDGGTVNASSSTIDGSGSIQNSGTMLLRDVDLNLLVANGALIVGNGAVNFSGVVTTTAASVLRARSDGSTGTAELSFLTGLSNFGTIELTSTGSAYHAGINVTGGTLVNETGGVIRSLSGTGGSRAITAQVSNAGSIVVDHALTWNGVSATQQNSGSITVSANLTVAQTGTAPSFSNHGAISIATGRTMSISGGSFTELASGITGSGTLAFINTTAQFVGAFSTGGLNLSAHNATLTGGGSVSIDAGRTFATRDAAINLPFTNAGLLTVDADVSLGGPVTTVAGSTIRLAASGSTGFATLSTVGFTNTAAIELTSTASSYASTLEITSGLLVNATSGSISTLVGTGGPRTIVGSVDNQGSIVTLQPLTWSGSNSLILNSGTLDVSAANLTINQAGPSTFSTTGTVNVGTGRTMTINGGVVAQDGGAFTGAGNLVLLNLEVAGPGSFVNPAGRSVLLREVLVTAPLVNEGTLEVDGNNSFQGALTASAGSTLRIVAGGSTGSSHLIVEDGFSNFGTIEQTATSSTYATSLTVNNGTLTNEPSGLITTLVGTGGPRTLSARIQNLGVIDVNQPLTWNNVSGATVNDGTITVDANLTVNQTGTSPSFTNLSGTSIAAARTLLVVGGAYSQTPGSMGGSGTLGFSNASVVFTSAFASESLTLSFNASAVTGAGSLTNSAGRLLSLLNSTIAVTLINEGLITADGNSGLSGTVFTTPSTSTIRVLPGGSTGFSNLSVTGFTNTGNIELTSSVSSYSSTLTVTGTLVNAPFGMISTQVGTGGSRNLVGAVDNQGGTITINHPLTWTANNANISNAGSLDILTGNLTVNQTGTSLFTHTGSMSIASGRAVTISGGSFTQLGGTYSGAGPLNLSSVTVAGPGVFVNPAGRTVNFNLVTVNAPLLNEGLLSVNSSSNINGAITTASGSTIRMASDGSTGSALLTVANGFTNEGSIDLSAAVSTYSSGLTVTSGTLVNASGGSINSLVGTGGTRALNASVQNDGTITVLQPLTWTAANVATAMNGQLSVSGGNLTVNQSGAALFTVTGTVDIGSGRSMTVNGGSFAQSGGSFTGAGPLNLASVTVAGPGTFVNPAGRTVNLHLVTVNAPLLNEGLLSVNSSSSINGAITTASGSTIRMASDGSTGSAVLTVANGFTNEGSIDLSAAASSYSSGLTVTSGTLVNASGGSINSLVGTGGTRALNASVQNDGSITVMQPLTWTAANVPTAINGQLTVGGANLTVNQSGAALFTVAGTVDISSGRSMTVNGGALTQTTGSFTGLGPLLLTGVTVSGPSAFVNPAGRTVTLRDSDLAAPITNAGTLDLRRSSVISGALTTVAGSLIRVGHDGSTGSVILSVSNGFTNNGTIDLTADVSAYTSGLSIGTGTLINATGGMINALPGTGGARSISGQIDNQGSLIIQQPTTWSAVGVANQNNGTLVVETANLTVNQSGGASFTSDGNINVYAGRIFRISGGTFEQTGGGFAAGGEFDLQDATVIGDNLTIQSPITMRLRNATINAHVDNLGTIVVATASAMNSTISNAAGATIRIASDGSVGSSTLTTSTGFTNNGTVELSATSSSYGAVLNLNGGTLTNGATGVLRVLRATGGSRLIGGDVVNGGQIAMAGDGGSVLNINGDLTTTGSITMELGGLSAGSGYDQIAVSGIAVLGGALNVTTFGAFTPASGNSFTLINSVTPLTGVFSAPTLVAPLSSLPTYLSNSVTVGVP